MKAISRDEVRQKAEADPSLALVEVLAPEQYDEFHLPGAMNVPLGEDFEKRIQKVLPDKQQPVVVYCMDRDCHASPKAAKKMDELGYQEVYDYEAGKVDWKAAGLPVEP